MNKLQSVLSRYGVATAAVAIALLIEIAQPWTQAQSPFLLFLVAVLVSVWYGGRNAGLWATGLAAVLKTVLLSLAEPVDNWLSVPVGLGLFLIIGGLVSVIASPQGRGLSSVEADLKESDERFRVTFEQAAVGLAHVGLDGSWLRVNRRLCDIVGYSAAELQQRTFQDITFADDLATDLTYLQQLLDGQRSTYAMEKRYVHEAGHLVWINLTVSLVRDRRGQPKYFISVIEDIRDRKQAQAELIESEARFRRAFVGAPFPIIIYAEDGEVLQISHGWTDLSGYALAEIPTIDDWTEKAYGSRKGLVREHIRQLFEADQAVDEGEFVIQTRDGSTRTWQFSSAPLGQLGDGRKLVISMASDVTALKRAGLKMQRFNEVLEQRVTERTALFKTANQELQAFSYSVSHDLRAPLRAMQGFSQALLEDYAAQLDDLGQDYAKRIFKAAAQMDQLISDLLAYGRLGRAQVKLQPLNLEALVQEVIQSLGLSAHSSQAQVEMQSPLPTVQGNYRIAYQVMTNLIDNGVKFVSPGVQPKLQIWAEEKPDCVRLWIADNGIGILPEHRQRIFDVFERLHGVEAYPGTGIGLAIVRRGVRRMGGNVGVELNPEQGSRFWVEFPRSTIAKIE
ncbi:PAS domain S-box protein [Romeria aff. gracilis LEGE 07310]|uniref:histidine kinase n=1 Tax=Vasconcelosia minhoensis LEGE 07310 TaxID=915328 RepID=A0A8J7AXJ0_9CYAN|nr:PAS domain S-box protein [Romeria gracilis]MBE9077892.1 PAS domain S-box protein [Romeria aff. gracilis LEGE 07310]